MCPTRFGTGDQLHEHMEKNHTKGTITPCEQCDEKFVTAYERNNHMKGAHATPMTYSSWHTNGQG